MAESVFEQHPKDAMLQELFITRFNALEGSKYARFRDAELNRIVSDFYNATLRVAEHDKRAQFVVLDEVGNILKDVKVEIRRVRIAGFILTPHLEGDHEKLSVSDKFTVKWPRSDSTLELKFYKTGYRSVGFAFRPRNRPDEDRTERARELLMRGILREPIAKGEAMRVVMPPNLIWKPDTQYRYDRDRNMVAFDRDHPDLVKLAGEMRNVVAATNGPVCHIVTKRGTYICHSKSGTIITARGFDRGSLLVVERVIADTGEPNILIEHPGGDSRLEISEGTEPYQWQFYAEPTARPLEDIKAEYEWMNRPPSQGRPVPNAPSTAPTAQP